ncbi:transcription cofactor vestigial-like protein 2 isoform X2 [Coturnix japonica]|uniref:transcription cofactor vestigial-like protein 2 isoform X2 n=1 Tax=Coturnix japonica TaxID=93934 RepID=UPI000777021B|nr:transcription cofactor vestigial-like protein 2 isoform X2 [Coturnix japonica]
MSCLDVMYQVYGPPQTYFAAAYSPYPQKLALYSKMQEAPESGSSAGASSSFSSHAAASIKEEECSPEKERPPEAEYISSRCVLFTYFQGDISAVVDEHFSRALSQPSSFSLGSAKAARNAGSWRDGSFPMSQRSFPPSFWNSAYQPSSVPVTLSSPLATHSELPFTTTDPYAPASLHGHLHQGSPEAWHHAHHHHHHHPYLGTQSTAYPRPTAMHEVYGPHFDPRYGSLLVPTASVRPHRLTPAAMPTPVSPPCELSKGEAGPTAAWTTSGAFPNAAGDVAQSLGLNVDAGKQGQCVTHSTYLALKTHSELGVTPSVVDPF